MIAGRNADCDIVVDYTTVSRKHLKIRGGPGNKVFITDLGSSNGSYLNRDTIDKNVEIEFKVGKRLVLGDSDKILILQDEMPIRNHNHQTSKRRNSSLGRKRSRDSSREYKRKYSSDRERSRSRSPKYFKNKGKQLEKREHKRLKPRSEYVDLRDIRESASTDEKDKLKLLKEYLDLRVNWDPKEILSIKLQLEKDNEEFKEKAKVIVPKQQKRKYL